MAVSAQTDHILPAIHRIGDRTAGYGPAEIGMPEQRAVGRVQRKEEPFPAPGKKKVRRGGDNAALGVIHHLEIPLLFAGPRIDGPHCAVSLGLRSIGNSGPASAASAPPTGGSSATAAGRAPAVAHVSLVFRPLARIALAGGSPVVIPCRHIEQSGARAERRRIPVRAALRTG